MANRAKTPAPHERGQQNTRKPMGELGYSADGEPTFAIYRPSVREQRDGHPNFKVTLFGNTWAEVMEGLRVAGIMSGHVSATKPIGELWNSPTLDQWWNRLERATSDNQLSADARLITKDQLAEVLSDGWHAGVETVAKADDGGFVKGWNSALQGVTDAISVLAHVNPLQEQGR